MNMKLSRRNVLKMVGALPLSGAVIASHSEGQSRFSDRTLPDKHSFEAMKVTYLNSASQHPISLASSQAAVTYLSKRRYDPEAPGGLHDSVVPLQLFSKLINADIDEVAYVQSTTAAEQMILRCLGFPECGGHIVTDDLHFPGSKPIYAAMEREGVEVSWVQERDGRIDLRDMDKAIRKETRLVSLSLVSTYNGFQHDLKSICEMAHAKDVLVYADIIHAAGCVPVDVKASGVDFAACASYKWLMGDFGLGFVYVRNESLQKLQQRYFGYFGLNIGSGQAEQKEAASNFGYPKSASGYFALGTRSFTPVAILTQSLEYILNIGVGNIQSHAHALTSRLKDRLPSLGYKLHTPIESLAPIVACRLDQAAQKLGPGLSSANIKISTYDDHFRISPSVFNSMDDIEQLLDVLARVDGAN